jgi:DNA-directed RNA polymerase specialized sigma24 family protein
LPVTNAAEPVRTRAEIASAIRIFTPAQWGRLRRTADFYALCSPMEAEDLLQEAFRRALEGDRNCPHPVDVVWFLKQAIRSIANADTKRAKREPKVVPLHPAGEPEAELQDDSANAEQSLEAAEEYSRRHQWVIGLFSDDPVAQVIVEGILEGMKGQDLRALTDLEPTAFESKRRLIRRRIEKNSVESKQ